MGSNRGGIDDRDEAPLVETPEPEYEWLDDPDDADFDLEAYEEREGLNAPTPEQIQRECEEWGFR